MILLPRSWRMGPVRSAVGTVAWALLLLGLYGGIRDGCSTQGWGSFIVVWLGILVLTLLAATKEGLTIHARALRLVWGVLLLPLSLVLQGVLQDLFRSACPA